MGVVFQIKKNSAEGRNLLECAKDVVNDRLTLVFYKKYVCEI